MTFAEILEELVQAAPGAAAAILCDDEGEYVELVCNGVDAYDVKLAGAQFSPLLAQLGHPRELLVRASDATYLIQCIADGYYVLLWLSPRASTSRSARVLRERAQHVAALM